MSLLQIKVNGKVRSHQMGVILFIIYYYYYYNTNSKL